VETLKRYRTGGEQKVTVLLDVEVAFVALCLPLRQINGLLA
jgi:hypothetical protein